MTHLDTPEGTGPETLPLVGQIIAAWSSGDNAVAESLIRHACHEFDTPYVLAAMMSVIAALGEVIYTEYGVDRQAFFANLAALHDPEGDHHVR
jgi:hypothetical protein